MSGLPIARIAGIEVRVHISWVVIVGLVTALAVSQIEILAPAIGAPLRIVLAALVGIGFFMSALVHDLSHALTARGRGARVPVMFVSFFGGTTPVDPEVGDGRSEAIVALVGPITSIAIGGGLTVVALGLDAVGGPVAGPVSVVALVLGALNLLLGVANLVPAYPFDGGRVVRGIGWWRSGQEIRGTMLAASFGRVIGWTIVGGGLAFALAGQTSNGILVAVTGWFLSMTARNLREQAQLELLLKGLRIDDFIERDVAKIAPGLTVDTFADGLFQEGAPSTAAVVGPSGLLGVLGIGQIRRLRRGRWATTRAEDLMASVTRLPPLQLGAAIWPALVRLRRSGTDGIPVVDGDGLVGVFTRVSVGRALRSRQGDAPGGIRS